MQAIAVAHSCKASLSLIETVVITPSTTPSATLLSDSSIAEPLRQEGAADDECASSDSDDLVLLYPDSDDNEDDGSRTAPVATHSEVSTAPTISSLPKGDNAHVDEERQVVPLNIVSAVSPTAYDSSLARSAHRVFIFPFNAHPLTRDFASGAYSTTSRHYSVDNNAIVINMSDGSFKCRPPRGYEYLGIDHADNIAWRMKLGRFIGGAFFARANSGMSDLPSTTIQHR
ncbi:unnamed protein product [Peniophora sp. CBMAI 1063]|nr:unnamed protein product [Peniophora sp. CBMAI 1063]